MMTPQPSSDPVILVVESDPDDQAFIHRALHGSGLTAHVVVARHAEEAIAYCRGFSPYQDRTHHPLPWLILTELKMPGMGGLELLAWLDSRPEFRPIPAVVLTSSPDQADVNAAFARGARGYMAKPVHFKQLETILQTIGNYWQASRMPARWGSTPSSAP